MTVALLNMVVIFGLPPNGEEVISLLSDEDGIGLSLAKKDTAYGSFITKFCATTDPVTETEYTAFLLY